MELLIKNTSDTELLEYQDKIGITKIIAEQQLLRWQSGGKKGKVWLALSPYRKEEKHNLETKYDIVYWVNYGDDETFGWFSVESIIEWLTTPDLLLYKLGGTRERIIH